MTRKERIVVLLENYRDVEEGIQDRNFRGDCSGLCALAPRDRWLCERYGCANGGVIAREGRALNHPSYRELQRCVGLLKKTNKTLYWHLEHSYFKYTEVTRAVCPRCGREYPPSLGWYEEKEGGGLCKHGQSSVKLMRVTKRRIREGVSPVLREEAIEWIDQNFQGEPFIPDDLLASVA